MELFNNILQIKKYHFNMAGVSPLNIKVFSDLHYSSNFNIKKLTKISESIKTSNTDYVIIPGDLIDTVKVIKDKDKYSMLLNWLEDLSKNSKVFFTLGNHDTSYKEKGKWYLKYENTFLEDLKKRNIYLDNYEDNNLIIRKIDLPYSYYFNEREKEDKDILLKELKNNIKNLTNLPKGKLKIFVMHSPIYLTDNDVLEYLKEFDFIICGHMHNGLFMPFLPFLNYTFGNRGLISPGKRLFPKFAKGKKEIKIDNHLINFIISGGITKIQDCAPKTLRWGNMAFVMQMDEIEIN